MAESIGGGEASGDQPDRSALHVAFAAGDLAGEAQPRLGLEPQPRVEQPWRIEVGVAVEAAEPGEFGSLKPWAVVQLRQDNALGTLFNMVGFQTKLKYGEQARVFRLIPGLRHAEFARLGGLHRNTFLNSPRLLDGRLRLRAAPRLRFAGQITGCEGYVESAAIGLVAGRFAAAERLGAESPPLPPTTAIGALLNHITGGHLESIEAGPRSFQPMNVNFGLFPPIEEPRMDETGKKLRGPERGAARKRALSARAEVDLRRWIGELESVGAGADRASLLQRNDGN